MRNSQILEQEYLGLYRSLMRVSRLMDPYIIRRFIYVFHKLEMRNIIRGTTLHDYWSRN